MSSFLRVDPRTGRLGDGDFEWSSLANTFVQAAPGLLSSAVTLVRPLTSQIPPPIQTVLTQLMPPQQAPVAIKPPEPTLASIFSSPAAKIGGVLALGYVLLKAFGGRR